MHASSSFRRYRLILALSLLLVLAAGLGPGTALASGVIYDGTPGTSAPPATLGPYTMTVHPLDSRATYTMTDTIYFTDDTFMTTASDVEIRLVGSSWATWSHGYGGSVYVTGDTTLTLTMPANTMAFYLYVEPNAFGAFDVTVTADGTSSGPVPAEGESGATYFGFYSLSDAIHTVTIEAPAQALGFAIGEFGICLGEPQSSGSPRADVAAVIYGGWAGMPVTASVGGTMQPTQFTAPNDEGAAATLFTFWPPAGDAWKVAVSPTLPGDLDAAHWSIVPVGVRINGTWSDTMPAGVTIVQGSQVVLYYQLIHTP